MRDDLSQTFNNLLEGVTLTSSQVVNSGEIAKGKMVDKANQVTNVYVVSKLFTIAIKANSSVLKYRVDKGIGSVG